MKNLLAVVLVVCVASMALSQNEPLPAPAEPVPVLAPAAADGAEPVLRPVTTQRWEYMVSDRGGFEPGAWQKKLNDLAKEGWELDAIDEGHYILRRTLHFAPGPGGAGFF